VTLRLSGFPRDVRGRSGRVVPCSNGDAGVSRGLKLGDMPVPNSAGLPSIQTTSRRAASQDILAIRSPECLGVRPRNHLLITRLKVRFLHGSPFGRGVATPPDSSFPASVGRCPADDQIARFPRASQRSRAPRPSDQQSSRLLSRIPGSGGPDRFASRPDSSEPPTGSPHRLQGEPRPRSAHLAPEAGSG
jgi:hypothetical protein